MTSTAGPGRRRTAVSPAVLPSLCLALLAAGCGGAGYAHVIERDLASSDGLECPGALVWNNEPVEDVFLAVNGSGTLSNAFVHPSFDAVLAGNRVAYATYDKPGIRAPFGDPAAARRDDSLLERYTLGHGVACATQALRWVRAQFGPAVRLHLRGHSEGTLVSLYTYDGVLDTDPDAAATIGHLVLSGLAVERFADILEHQLATLPAADADRLRAAFASCDWAVLRDSVGISCAYVADATQRPSGREMFERLAARAAPARFDVFQGTEDWNTPVEPVRALEAWNAATGGLQLRLHYYEGGHMATDAARAEMAALLAAIVAE